MIDKITRGDQMGGLVHYLLGPGRGEEHHNQRVIAGAGISAPRGVELSGEEVTTLAFEMDLPRRIHGTRVARRVNTERGAVHQAAHVWHVSLSNAGGDRRLSDAEWGRIAQDLMDRLQFSSGPGRPACPWVAVRHGLNAEGYDHIHIAVSLVREDGTKAGVHNDRRNVGAACSHYERAYGLQVVQGRFGGAQHRRTPGEVTAEKQRRLQRPDALEARPGHTRLESTVRAAAVGSASEAEFVRRLRSEGLALRPRFAQGGREAVVGYSVGIRGDNIVWYGGGRLAGDLTLPKLRALWASDKTAQSAAVVEWKRDAASKPDTAHYPATEWHQAAAHVRSVVDRLSAVPASDDATWRSMASEAAGVVGNLALRFEAEVPGHLTRAADKLNAATHRPSVVGSDRGRAGAELRGVAAVAAQALLPDGPAAWLSLLAEVRRLVRTIEHAHAASAAAGAARSLASEAAKELDAVHTRYARAIAVSGGAAPLHQPAGTMGHEQLPASTPPTPRPGFAR